MKITEKTSELIDEDDSQELPFAAYLVTAGLILFVAVCLVLGLIYGIWRLVHR